MSDPTMLLVLGPAAQRSAIEAVAIPGGWGAPALSANGLCAWGVPATTLDDATQATLRAITGVTVEPLADNWKATAGWIDPVTEL